MGADVTGRKRVLLTASLLFLLHFLLNLAFSGDVMHGVTPKYYVESTFRFVEQGPVGTHYSPFYIGVPVFVLPIFWIFGTDPMVLKGIMAGFMGFSTVFLFMAYERKYGFIRGLYMVLFLFTTVYWLGFQIAEMPIILFGISVLLYLFVRWYEEGERRMLYYIAGISGLFAYVKWSYGKAVLALAFGTVVTDWQRVRETIDVRLVVVALAVFSLSLSPLIAYNAVNEFPYRSVISPDRVAGSGAATSSLLDRGALRVRQLVDGVLRPVIDPLHHLHVYVLLLLAGTIYSLFRGERVYTVTFLISFLMLFYTGVYGAKTYHLTVLLPFIPIVIGYTVDMLPDTSKRDERILFLVFLLAVLSVAVMDPVDHGGNPYYFSLDAYDDFREVNVSPRVATNFLHMYYIAGMDDRVEQQYFLGAPKGYRGRRMSFAAYRGVDGEGLTVILVGTDVCPSAGSNRSRAVRCGIPAAAFWNRTALSRDDAERVAIGQHAYYIHR